MLDSENTKEPLYSGKKKQKILISPCFQRQRQSRWEERKEKGQILVTKNFDNLLCTGYLGIMQKKIKET